jgi:hypothetical protein
MAGEAVSVKPAWQAKQSKSIEIIKLLVTPVQTGLSLFKITDIKSKQAFAGIRRLLSFIAWYTAVLCGRA